MRVLFRTIAVGSLLGVSAYYKLYLEPKPIDEYPHIPNSTFDNSHFVTKSPRQIGIIGGGFAGLIACKTLAEAGFSAEILEKSSELGGVWRKNYHGLRLQAPYNHFNLPDFSFPPDTEMFPRSEAVKAFIQSYAEHFDLVRSVQYNSEVVELSQNKDASWTVRLADGTLKNYDFLVLATGVNTTPFLPQVPGHFGGIAVHSSQVYDAPALLKNKKVVVVGGNKSSWDMVALAAQHSSQVTWTFRSMSWHIPPLGTVLGMPLPDLVNSRFGTYFILPHEEGWTLYTWKWLTSIFQWLVRRNEASLPEDLRCTKSPDQSYNVSMFARDDRVVQLVQSGKVSVVKGSPTKFTESGIDIDGTHLDCDVVVFCTGFETSDLLKERNLWLYRNTLVPHKKNLAVLGMHHQFWIPLYDAVQAVWLVNVLKGRVALPTHQEMAAVSESRQARFTAVYGPVKNLEFSYPTVPLLDQLIQDMQLPVQRAPTLHKHLFGFLKTEDYAFILRWV